MLFTLNEEWQTENVNKFHNRDLKTVKTEYGNFEFEFSAGQKRVRQVRPIMLEQ